MQQRVSLTFCFFLILSALIPAYSAVAQEKGRFYFEKRGKAVWEVPTDRKVIALTFDDGPSPKYTPEILDTLKKYHAKATFFVVGQQVLLYPKLTKRIEDEGNELANHTYSHPSFYRLSKEQIREQIQEAEEAIHSVTNVKPSLFRPTGGYYNEKIIDTARGEGYTVVLWSWDQDTKDWSKPGVGKIVKNVLTHASNGDIVLFHDRIRGRSQTVEALKIILSKLEARGYRFVTVSDLLDIGKSDKWLKKEFYPPVK